MSTAHIIMLASEDAYELIRVMSTVAMTGMFDNPEKNSSVIPVAGDKPLMASFF
jgi:hypothetical protein